MIGFKQSVKVFSAKFSLPIDPQKFSPSKVYCYTVNALPPLFCVVIKRCNTSPKTCFWVIVPDFVLAT